MNLTINNLIKGVQSAPFLACSGLVGSIPAASIPILIIIWYNIIILKGGILCIF